MTDVFEDAEVLPVRTASWPVRVYYSSSSALYEFDRQGNVVSKNGSPFAGAYVAEYYQRGTPLWPGSQRIYYIVRRGQTRDDFRPEDVTNAIVLADQQACTPSYISDFYKLYRNLSTIFLNGLCRDSVKQRIGTHDYWVYPDEWNDAIANMSVDTPVRWTFQRFDDPIEPIFDAAGICRLYCEGRPLPPSKGSPSGTSSSNEAHRTRPGLRPEVDLSPPANNALRQLTLEERLRDKREQEEVPATNWPVRAIFNSRAGAFEFDRQGNLIQGGTRLPLRAVEIRLGGKEGRPLWQGGQQVYRLLAPGKLGYGNDLLGTDDGLVLVNGHACPTQLIAEAYGILHEGGELYLNGNCTKAVKRTIGEREFWVYPEDETSAYPHYWVVQHFDDPITPIVDAEGQCWLYCDGRSQQGG
ncbi:hypothetical protein P3W85_22265 [Cupriavidus basilensis]|uniref:Uncharacterized protein n=1 Tax=Cupriavidus basilensis TaxID=68895 RepID=A0ABT6AST4_9BURK|nr:hypothetical protein [Cupriavidus basilensis]MDF3835653.1 hypothetical protein [Cupriavidus basilensis]